ncbi:MAG: metalloregulator ArsR/SmtB family transcription factor [Anaerolineaceae bacterium]
MNTIENEASALNDFKIQSELLKALAHPTRLAILCLLREGPQCVCHIEAHLGLRQAYISQQLAVLRAAGLVDITREGWNIYYAVTNAAVFEVLDLAQAITGVPKEPDMSDAIHCPCPKCSTLNNQTAE